MAASPVEKFVNTVTAATAEAAEAAAVAQGRAQALAYFGGGSKTTFGPLTVNAKIISNKDPGQPGFNRRNVPEQFSYAATATVTASETSLIVPPPPPPAPPPPSLPSPEPVKSAGQQVVNEDGPSTQKITSDGRIVTPPATTTPTTATPTSTAATGDVDRGTDDPVRTTTNTQATGGEDQVSTGPRPAPGFGDDDVSVFDRLSRGPQDPTGVLAAEDAAIAAEEAARSDAEAFGPTRFGPTTAPTNPGTPTNDDAANSSTTTAQATVNAAGNDDQVTPQPNALDLYASYTWSASVYLVTNEQYNQMVASRRANINGYQLLFQSGGAPVNQGGFQGSAYNKANASGPNAGRNPAFDLDFYIDSVTIDNALPGKVTTAAHMVSEIKFTVIEPNGITLIDRLHQAVQDFAPKNSAGEVNYVSCVYLMAIRFYGYDSGGSLVSPVRAGGPGGAVIEKYIPFLIQDINFGVSSKLVTYDFVGAPVGQIVGLNSRRGTVPFDVELASTTVGKLLAGDAKAATAAAAAPGQSSTASGATPAGSPAPAKANTAPNKRAVPQGLMAAINEHMQNLVKQGVYGVADAYDIEFAAGAEDIAAAQLILPGQIKDKTQVPMALAQDPDSKLQEKLYTDYDTRLFAITAGQQISQTIELAIRNSSYIYNQALSKNDVTTGLSDPGDVDRLVGEMNWYQITMEVRQGQYDELRNDYAYNIKYIVSKMSVTNFFSRFFPRPKFKGLHKSYKYWFTGENTSVVDYTANFNYLYHITVSGDNPKQNDAANIRKLFTSSMLHIPYFNYAPRSRENSAGAPQAPGGSGQEIQASAAEYLYDPSSLGECQVRIIGDPAWIQQGSQAFGLDPKTWSYSPFLPDGTINFDSRQVMFEIAWQRPEDYNMATGVADPYSKATKPAGDRQPTQSYIYQATRCVSEFRGGKFEQVLHGALYIFPKPNVTNNKAPSSPGVPKSGVGFGDDEDATELFANSALAAGNQRVGSGTGFAQPQLSGQIGLRLPALSPVSQPSTVPGTLGSITYDLLPQTTPQLPNSNGLTLGGINFRAPLKLGQTGAPVVAQDQPAPPDP